MPQRNIDKWPGAKFKFASLAQFLRSPVPSGIITIEHNGVPIDISNEPAEGCAPTVVMLHAAVSRNVRFLPIFTGIGVTSDLNANVIRISDPSLSLDSTLELSWYAGNQHQSLQNDLSEIVDHILTSYSSGRVVFFGSSGGGFAAAYFGSKVPGSLAIAVNPQFILSEYTSGPVDKYLSSCFNVSVNDDHVERVKALSTHIDSDLRLVYNDNPKNVLAVVQNTRDTHHYQKHLLPFLDALPDDNSVYLSAKDWGKGHKPPTAEYISHLLKSAVDEKVNWAGWLNDCGFIRSPTSTEAVALRG